MKKQSKTNYTIKSIQRALDIMNYVANEKPVTNTTDIIRKLNITPSSAKKLLRTLERYDYLEYSPYSDQYRLGVKTFQISTAYSNKLDVNKTTINEIRALRDKLNESVFVSILRKGSVVYINYSETNRAVRVAPVLANLRPAYATSCGKAQLAFRNPNYANSYYPEKFQRLTDNTITDINQLHEELAKVKEIGFAIDNEEYHVGVRGVGIAAVDFMSKPRLGISIIAPKDRLSPDRIEGEIAPLLLEMRDSISRKFGYASDISSIDYEY